MTTTLKTYLGESIPHGAHEPTEVLTWLWKSTQWPKDSLEDHLRNLIKRLSDEGKQLDASSHEALVRDLIRVGFLMEVK